jgi:asparagine synthetase B (glutamine-hydrolysing)
MGPHLADLCRAGEWRQLAREARLGADAGLGGAGHLLARAALEQLPGTWRSVVARLAQRQVHGLHADLVGYWRPLAIPAPRRAGRASHMTAALSTLVRTTSLPALLRYLDRNGMAWSLEPRVPFLDTRVAAASRALSSAARFSRGLGKSVLRDARWSRLPRLVAERRQKNGFLTPESAWWRGALRSWAIDVLDPGSVARNGVLDAAAVARVRDDLRSPEGPPPPAGLWRWINIELWMQARDAGLASEAG